MDAELRERYRQRGEAAYYPVIVLRGTHTFEGERGWIRLLEQGRDLMPGDLTELESQLARAEREDAPRRRAVRDMIDEMDRRAEEHARPFSPEEEAERQRELAEIREEAAYRRSTEGRLERVESVLIEIRDLLQRQPR